MTNTTFCQVQTKTCFEYPWKNTNKFKENSNYISDNLSKHANGIGKTQGNLSKMTQKKLFMLSGEWMQNRSTGAIRQNEKP